MCFLFYFQDIQIFFHGAAEKEMKIICEICLILTQLKKKKRKIGQGWALLDLFDVNIEKHEFRDRENSGCKIFFFEENIFFKFLVVRHESESDKAQNREQKV